MNEEELFHKALAITDTHEREAFLDRACSGQPELRAGVAALLSASDPSTGILDRPAVCRNVVDGPSMAVPEGPGARIGPYKLIEQIGEGGFGVVYLAEQQEPIRRKVALKTIKLGMDTRHVVARFEAERQALALMDHPNIARVLDGGVTPAGRPFFVMDLVKGIPITRYCDEHQLLPRARLELIAEVCQAVQHAHQKGIIHRDLKPTNILVAAEDGSPVPKVIDFGVAKALGQTLTERTLVTGFGNIVGTLEYMSPEQAEFNARDVDTRTDIYSLGAVLYELLTGTTPLTKERLSRSAMDECLRCIREEEPPSPSHRLSDSKERRASISAQRGMEPARLDKELRGELDWIVMKCLEKDRNRRYPTANGLVQDIERYLHDEPIDAGPPSSSYRLRKFLRRNRGPVCAAALVLLALIGGILGTSWGMVRAERERLRANKESDRAIRNLETSNENLDLAVKAVDQFFMQVSSDERLKEHDLRPLRQSLLKSAVEFHQKLLDSRKQDKLAHTDLARSHHRLGELTAEIDAANRAIRHYQQAIEEFEQVLKSRPDDVDTQCELAESLAGLGTLFTVTSDAEQAERALRRGIELLESILEKEPHRSSARQQLASSLGRLAFALSMNRRFDEAKTAWHESIDQWTQLTQDHPKNVAFVSQLAHAYMKLGTVTMNESITQWPDAAAECETALALQREAVSRPDATGFERRVLSAVLRELARMKMVSGHADDAIPLLQESVDHLERLHTDQPTVLSHAHDLAIAWSQLGDCKKLIRDVEASEAAYLKAAELEEGIIAMAPGNATWESLLAEVLLDLGDLALLRNQLDTALASYDRSASLLDQIFLRDPQFTNVQESLPYVLSARGRLLASLGRADQGLADCDRAVEMTVDQLDRCDNLRLDRAWVRLQTGDYEQSAAEARQALESLADRCDLRFLPPRFVLGARVCSRAAALARNDDTRPAERRQSLAARYEMEAIDMLQRALDGGLRDPAALEAEEFASLEARPEFADVMQAVGKRAASTPGELLPGR